MNKPTRPHQNLIAALTGDVRLREFEFSAIQTVELAMICNRMIDVVSAQGFEDTARARGIICRRFGIGTAPETLKAIAQSHQITTARVCQIEVKFLRQMKHPYRIFFLKEFLADAGLCERPAALVIDFVDALRQRVRDGEILSDEDLSTVKMDELELSVRSLNSLRQNGIITLVDLKPKTRQTLLRMDGFGRKCLIEVERTIAGFGVILKDT